MAALASKLGGPETVAAATARRRFRHVVVLGDVLLDAYHSIDKTPGKFEDALLPGTRDQWKISVISSAKIERAGPSLALPRDATHALIFIEGMRAIEESGLLEVNQAAFGQTLEHLALAADEFERTLERLIQMAQAARLVSMVCTMYAPNYKHPARQRAASAALAVLNDRVTKRAAETRVSLIDLRLTCNEAEDYDKPTQLSQSGLQKAANVIRYAMLELDAGARRSEMFF
jgi:hypothetical protein